MNPITLDNPPSLDTDRRAQLAPMVEFYEALGRPLPPAVWVEPQSIPHPARALLVHSNDMTPTLERWYGDEMTLRTLDRHHNGDTLSRMVVLETVTAARPSEFGMIQIHLDRFDKTAREQIVGCRIPLGTILGRRRINHTCHVGGYVSIISDATMNRALGLTEPTRLWGRCNLLLDDSHQSLAEVVEILAPATDSSSKVTHHDHEG